MQAFAFALLQDSSQQISNNMAAGMGIGMVLFFVVFVFAMLAFVVYLLWRIFTKAGLSGAMAFLMFVPGVGGLIVLCVLAFADWKVVPIAATPYAGLPPQYPPTPLQPPTYPPQG